MALIASSSGSTGRRRSQTRIARSAPADADVDVEREGVVAPRDVLQAVDDPAVVLGVDDVLLAVVAPRVRARRAERDAARAREREQPLAQVALAREGVREVLAAAGADLDLADEISSPAIDSASSGSLGRRRVAQLLEARGEVERLRGRGSRTPPRSRP